MSGSVARNMSGLGSINGNTDIARAQGMTRVAEGAGLSRESLYKSLSGERVPDFSTVLKVMKSLGLKLHTGVA